MLQDSPVDAETNATVQSQIETAKARRKLPLNHGRAFGESSQTGVVPCFSGTANTFRRINIFEKHKKGKELSDADGVVQDVRAHVERIVTAKMDKVEGRVLGLLSRCSTEVCVGDESDVLKVVLDGVETRFMDEHTALAKSTNEQKATTKAQSNLLGVLWGEAKRKLTSSGGRKDQ